MTSDASMTVVLSGLPPADEKSIFRVRFVNGSTDSSALPLSAIQRHGARDGLHFFLQRVLLKPIDKVLVTPKFVLPEAMIPANQAMTLEFEANTNEKAPGVYELAFEDVTYQGSGSLLSGAICLAWLGVEHKQLEYCSCSLTFIRAASIPSNLSRFPQGSLWLSHVFPTSHIFQIFTCVNRLLS